MNLTPVLNPNLLVQAGEESLNKETISQNSPATVYKKEKKKQICYDQPSTCHIYTELTEDGGNVEAYIL